MRLRRAALDLGVLAALGTGVVLFTAWLGAELDPGDFGRPIALLAGIALAFLVLWGLAVLWVLARRPPARAAFVLVVLVAAASRLFLVQGEPALSNDVFRYVWDGRVQAAGINPYAHAPADPALAHLRDEELYARLNREEVRTIYPPVAQGAFRLLYLLHPDSVAWTKLALVALDLAAVVLLASLLVRVGRRPELSLLYAWHPLAIFEIGGSGHLEALLVLLLLLALHAAVRGRALLAGIALGAAGLVKFYALSALPALAGGGRRIHLAAAVGATVLLAYLPFAEVGLRALGYLPGYLEEEGFASGYRFYLLGLVEQMTSTDGAVLTAGYVVLSGACLAGVALASARGPATPGEMASRALLLLVLMLVLATPTYPWYALVVIALLPLGRGLVLLPASAVTLTAPLLYLHISIGSHPTWPRHLVYGAGAAALALAAALAVGRRRLAARPQPAPPALVATATE